MGFGVGEVGFFVVGGRERWEGRERSEGEGGWRLGGCVGG